MFDGTHLLPRTTHSGEWFTHNAIFSSIDPEHWNTCLMPEYRHRLSALWNAVRAWSFLKAQEQFLYRIIGPVVRQQSISLSFDTWKSPASHAIDLLLLTQADGSKLVVNLYSSTVDGLGWVDVDEFCRKKSIPFDAGIVSEDHLEQRLSVILESLTPLLNGPLRRYITDASWPRLPWTDASPLHVSPQELREFASQPGNLELTNERGETLLSLVCRHGHCELVHELLQAGAAPGCGALSNLIASWSGSEEEKLTAVSTLLDAGCDPDQPGTRGQSTPLDEAAAGNSLKIVKLLLERGARKVGTHRYDGAVGQILWSALSAYWEQDSQVCCSW